MSDLVSQIQDLYNFKDIKLDKLDEGFVGLNHILYHSGDKYFFKMIPIRHLSDESRIQEICSVYDLMCENDIPVELPIPNISGQKYSLIGDTFCMLFKMVEGTKFENLEPHTIQNAFDSSAQNLANIHLAGSKLPLLNIKKSGAKKIENSFLEKLDEIEQIIKVKSTLDSLDVDSLELIKWKRILFAKGLFIIPEEKKTTIIHGDFHRENLLFDTEGNITKIFDWDATVISANSWEVVYAMMKVCFYDKFENYDTNIAKAFLSQYSNIFPFSAQDLRDGFHYWMSWECLFIWSLRNHYLHNQSIPERFIIAGTAKLKFLSENLDDLLSDLSSF
jgi:Ser/Thr protein kinase RdoA (MazF antagonist)